MQYKALATLFFATAALAAPAAESDSSSSDIDTAIESDSIPSNILSVLETAVPTTWLDSFYTDAAFQSSEINEILSGTYPAWYSSLPESVKQYATSEVLAEASELESYYTAMPTNTASSSAHGASSSGAVSSTPLTTSTSTATTSGSSSSSSASASGESTSTSTAGAPAATGGIAMSLAGAAGILGLALAL
ncbi:hypothetical protein N7462_003943 [Penicillium macrosclerotiorum]|uniref:uncharacterized protein n=1 Tax=Penicillium macrosclerotiorum TaxID=303699 RepID=UPI002547A11D|nr:uncharacterized protein N7462_003943 [Penicillium macrosclerotiorum]KAJ5689551.1 hypothetical protein N7462_003943 [Penicillium macrosclerotiorum]